MSLEQSACWSLHPGCHKRLLRLVKPVGYHLFQLFQVGVNETAERWLRNTKRDLIYPLEQCSEGQEIRVYSIFLVREEDLRKRR